MYEIEKYSSSVTFRGRAGGTGQGLHGCLEVVPQDTEDTDAVSILPMRPGRDAPVLRVPLILKHLSEPLWRHVIQIGKPFSHSAPP